MKKIKKALKPSLNSDTELSYNGKTYKIRQFGFKTFTLPANKIVDSYKMFLDEYNVSEERSALQKLVLQRPELLNIVGISKSQVLNDKHLEKIGEFIKNEPEYALKAINLQNNIARTNELFLLSGNNAEQICNCLFEECDIDHNDYVDSLTHEEFNVYLEFMNRCLNFFLLRYLK